MVHKITNAVISLAWMAIVIWATVLLYNNIFSAAFQSFWEIVLRVLLILIALGFSEHYLKWTD